MNKWTGVKKDIEFKIINGEYIAGEKIPPIREIAEKYNIGISTAQKVVDALEKDNIIYKKKGIGFFVRPYIKKILLKKQKIKLQKQLIEIIKEAKKIGIYEELMDTYNKKI